MVTEVDALSHRSAEATASARACSIRRHWLPVLAVLVFSIFAWSPLLTPAYFFHAHDAPHSVFFLVEFDQTLRDGYVWPRWSPDFAFGYGYPLFNIYSPLAFYAAEILHLLGFSFVAAVKAMYVLATIGGGLAMYGLLARRLLWPRGRRAGGRRLHAGPLSPAGIYVRSSYSEFVALALLPLVLWAFAELIAAPSLRRVALAGLVYGILALTHHTSLFTFTPFLVIYVAVPAGSQPGGRPGSEATRCGATVQTARWRWSGGAGPGPGGRLPGADAG